MAIEEPKFQVVEEFSGIEIRRMSAYWTVEIELEGDEKEVGNQAFRPLLKYISGENKGSEKIAMTGPVNQQAVGEPLWSRYDPPFMPWFLRRNEVQVEVKPSR